MRTYLIQFVVALLSVVTSGPTSIAQVFIVDQGYRDALNAAVPGLVDGNGMMDTAHPGLANVDSLVLSFDAISDSVELNGLEHFSAVQSLSIGGVASPTWEYVAINVPHCPPALTSLGVSGAGAVTIEEQPAMLTQLNVSASPVSATLSVTMNNPPNVIGTMWLGENTDLEWNNMVSVDQLHLWNYAGSAALPPMAVTNCNITGVMDTLDMSAMSIGRLLFFSCTVFDQLVLPEEVTYMYYDVQAGAALQSWPSAMDTLHLRGFNYCDPPFPGSLRSLEYHYGPSCIQNWPPLLDSIIVLQTDFGTLYENTATYCSVLNSECPGAYPALAGVVRMDLNNNGTADADEPMVPSSTVTIAPGGQSTGCAPDGSWQIGVPPGEHSITTASGYPYAISVSPSSHSGSVPAMGDVDLNNDFAVTVLPDIQDLRVHVYAFPARPGFENQVHVRCENYGTTPVDAELTLAFDADQTWIGSSVAPTSTSSNTVTWNFPAMPIGTVQHIVVELNTSVSVPLGTNIAHVLTANPIATDETPLDNTFTFTDSVVGSYDPNDKLLSPAVLTPDEVALGETPIEYTIRFQNTGTYLAERVVILDTLSEDLQWESIRFIASSHAQQWYITDGVLHVIHNDIMLPDSNANEAGSHGFFSFSMLPKNDLQDGAVITNIAHIVFDFNAPIITPPAVFSVDIGAGVTDARDASRLNLFPNPAHDHIQLRSLDGTTLHYRIIDVVGAQVLTGTTPSNGWVNISMLNNGAYLVEVEQGDFRKSQRFVKQ